MKLCQIFAVGKNPIRVHPDVLEYLELLRRIHVLELEEISYFLKIEFAPGFGELFRFAARERAVFR